MAFKRIILAFLGILVFVVGTGIPQAQISQFSDLDYPYPVQYQELNNDQQIAYIDEGEGPAVILIHGLGSYIPTWKQNVPVLTKAHRIIALDLPGYGKSSKEVDQVTIPFFAETVAALQDSLRIDQAVWAGHSMGGQIALRGALTYPDKISRLVLLAPAGFESFTEPEGATMSNFVTPQSIQATSDSMVRQKLRAIFHDFPKEAEFMIEDRIAIRDAKNFKEYARGYSGSVQAMLDGPVIDELSSIAQPTLIIFGKQDTLIPNRQFHPELTSQKVALSGHEKMPNSKLKMVDEAGHFVHFEQSGEVNQIMLNFLKDE